MKRRFQFSLRAAIALTLIASIALGICIRWPYYLAGKALDGAAGDTSFDAWPTVRLALIHDRSFRDAALARQDGFKLAMLHRSTFYLAKRTEQIILSLANEKTEWVVKVNEDDGAWSVERLVSEQVERRRVYLRAGPRPQAPAQPRRVLYMPAP